MSAEVEDEFAGIRQSIEANVQYLKAKAAVVHRERRERIATAALQGLLADSNARGDYQAFVTDAVTYADLMIIALDKPA